MQIPNNKLEGDRIISEIFLDRGREEGRIAAKDMREGAAELEPIIPLE